MNLTKQIQVIFGLKGDDSKKIFLPFMYSFFSGVALAFFVTSATAIFISSFSRDMLSVVFIASGIIVWLIGQWYSFIQKKKMFHTTVKMGMAFLLLSVVLLVISYSLTLSVFAIFLLYAWIRVFAYLQAVTFWGTLGRLFELQQAKRVFGLITGGEVLASIISFFSIPLLVKFLSTEQLLIISGLALIVAYILMMFLVSKNADKLQTHVKKNQSQDVEKSTIKISFFQNKYYKLIFFIAFIPIFAQFFVDFIFQAQLKIEFPDKDALTTFVSVFFGVSSIIEFILKAFVSGRMMSKYGIKLGLLAFPVVLAFSFLLASMVGVVYGTISLFFSFVALGRLFTRAVRTSFNDPASQILFQPLPADERVIFQNRVESGPKAYASIVAGILLFIFVKIPGMNLEYFAVFLFIVILIWLKFTFDIYTEYKIILQSVLKSKENFKPQTKTDKIFDILAHYILNAKTRSQLSIVKLTRIILPFHTYKLVKEHDIQMFETVESNFKFKDLMLWSKSEKPTERRFAAAEFSNYQIYKVERLLKKLLTDENFRVRTEAIITAGKMKDKDFFYALINNFSIREFSDTSASAIKNVGNEIVTSIIQLFRRMEFNTELQLKIISVLEEIGGKEVVNFFKTNLNYPNKIISERIILALGSLNYKSNKSEKLLFSNKLEEEIDNYVYITACLFDLKELNDDELILSALQTELLLTLNKIMSLLSVIYDSTAIYLIKQNLDSETSENRSFALEIADLVIDEEHKNIVLPIFNKLSISELLKIFKLTFAYPNLTVKQRLINIVNSPVGKISFFSKTTALKYLLNFPTSEVIAVLKANIINKSEMMRQIAAQSLLVLNENLYDEFVVLNTPKFTFLKLLPTKNELRNNFNKLIYNKLVYLHAKDLFKTIEYHKLQSLAEETQILELNNGSELHISVENASWFYILFSGLLLDNEKNSYISDGDILCIYNTTDNLRELVYTAKNQCVLLRAKIYILNNLLLEDEIFAQKYASKVWSL